MTPKPRKPAWTGDWPLPKSVQLPGMRVRVKILPHDEIVKRGARYGYFVYTFPTTATLYISDHWPLPVQRYILWHELLHAANDGLDNMIENFPEHVQTHTMATLATVAAVTELAAPADLAVHPENGHKETF